MADLGPGAPVPRSRWPSRWWRRRGLRARVTITASAGLLIAFVIFDLLLFTVLRVSLTRSLDDSARQSASGVAALIAANRLPDPVPVAPGITIQVVGPSGRITDVSPGADRLVPLLTVPQASASATSGNGRLLAGPPFGMPSLLRVDAVRSHDGSLVIAAVPYNSVSDSLAVVAKGLLAGTPVLFGMFAWVTWLVVGSTLRPVGALRRAAARVTQTGVPRPDLPVPEARDEVRELALTLNDMLSRLAAAQRRQRALVSDTAHELRSPITSIRTQLEVALDHPSLQEWEATARDVHADTLRLSRLAEDLLLLARLDEQAAGTGPAAGGSGDNDGVGDDPAGRPHRRHVPVDLASLATEVVARYPAARVPVRLEDTVTTPGRAIHDPEGAAVARVPGRPEVAPGAPARGSTPGEVPPPIPEDLPVSAGSGPPGPVPLLVAGDKDGLDRLLVNLIDNAARYAASRVTVTARACGQWAELTVTDDGPGIPPADLERAFDRFARLDSARTRDEDECAGAGLGLAIVRATAQAHGGTARLEPAEDPPGLRAIVRLPQIAMVDHDHACSVGLNE